MLTCVSPSTAASSTGLIYIDPSNLRRSSAISNSAAVAAAALEASNSSSYLTSASSLARAYSIVIRQISDLMGLIPKYNHLVYSQYPAAVKLTYQDAVNLQVGLGVSSLCCMSVQSHQNKFTESPPDERNILFLLCKWRSKLDKR